MATAGQVSTSGRAKSCTACRQVKLACDARKKAPGPCSRCSEKQLECRFNPNFKRISTRKAIRELTNELHALPSIVRLGTISATTPNVPLSFSHSSPLGSGSSLPQRPQGERFESPAPSEADSSSRPWLQLAERTNEYPYTLGDVVLQPQTAMDILSLFDRCYLPHLPILEPVHSVSSFAQRSPLLFWTIILVASERTPMYRSLYNELWEAHEKLLSTILHTSIQSLQAVHALLVLCLWPVPKVRHSYDPSWLYSGMAITGATHLGLHQPSPTTGMAKDWMVFGDFALGEFTPRTRVCTWLGCFAVGVRMSSGLGLPPPLSAPQQLQTVRQACELHVDKLPPGLQVSAQILRVVSLYTNTIDSIHDSVARMSLCQTYESDLDQIKCRCKHDWSLDAEIELQYAKLLLYGQMLVEPKMDPEVPSGKKSAASETRILHQGLTAANLFISSMAQLCHTCILPLDSVTYPAGGLTFYPKWYFVALVYAAMFVFKFLSLFPGANIEARTRAVSGLTEAHRILQSFPDSRDHVRGAIHIQYIVELLRSNAYTTEPFNTPIITERLGASIMYDAVFKAALHHNRHPAQGHYKSPKEWISMNQEHQLPEAPEQAAARAKDSVEATLSEMQGFDNDINWSWEPWDTYMMDFGITLDDLGDEPDAVVEP